MTLSPPHSFHIPVMGICYTIDTPLKVGRYGINSVVSIIEDELLEDLREHYSVQNNLSFERITTKEPDFRAKRITAYLNMMQVLLNRQFDDLRAQSLDDESSDITRYFQLLHDQHPLKQQYNHWKASASAPEKASFQKKLVQQLVCGAIDVNIMAKVDRMYFDEAGEKLAPEYSHALTALRGFANSNLHSSVVLSAGYNPALYNYLESFADFFPDAEGKLAKTIILKVSDYRSAMVQGKILAKKGIWISEFRVESGLNCGGHAFPTEGLLLGPILEEFKNNRTALATELFSICQQALAQKGKSSFASQPSQKLSAQGGIGTAGEHEYLLQHYKLDGAGWGSPFLMVPEATNVDEATLNLLIKAKQSDYYISNASPLGVPFNNFKNSSSEKQRIDRIAKNRAGSPCYKQYLSSNTEYTNLPICTASRQYYVLKEKELAASGKDAETIATELQKVADKDCLCEGLTAAVRIKNNLPIKHNLSAVTICPGPNLAWFSGSFTLDQMVGNIYGRTNIINDPHRPHMFINEVSLYVAYLQKLIDSLAPGCDEKQQRRYINNFKKNLLEGIAYYKINHLGEDEETFNRQLIDAEKQVIALGCQLESGLSHR